MYRLPHILDGILTRIIVYTFILVLLIGVYMTLDAAHLYYDASVKRVKSYKPEEITEETMQEISKDMVAWITIPETSIDYPIMQGKSNNDYLNTNPYGEFSFSGSIFLDSYNAYDFTDDYSLVYGHHMASGYMFGALDDYHEESFFDQHRYGTLQAGDTTYVLHVLGVDKADAGMSEIFDVTTKLTGEERYAFFAKEADIFRGDEREGGALVALTTCKEPGTTNRTVVMCEIYEQTAP